MAERAQATLPIRKLSRPGPLPSSWTWAKGGIKSSGGACRQRHHNTPPSSSFNTHRIALI
jgi:hypothetical protein